MRHLRRWMSLAVTDLRGDLRRFIIFVLYLALGTSVIAAVGSVGASLKQAVDRDAALLMGGDIEVTLSGRGAFPEEFTFLQTLGGVTHGVDTNANGRAHSNSALLDLMAVDENYPLAGTVVSPQLEPGQAPAGILGLEDGTYGALVDPVLLDWLGIDVGERFEIGGRPFTARGIIGSIPDSAARGFRLGLTTMISTQGFDALGEFNPPLPGLVNKHRYKILLAGMDAEAAKRAVLQQLESPALSVRTPRDAAGTLVRYYDLFAHFLPIMGLAALLVGGIGISNSITSYINERRPSIAVLRSLGASRNRVLVHYFTQIGVLTLFGVGLGIAIGALAAQLLLPMVAGALNVDLAATLAPVPLLVAAGFGILTGFGYCYVPLMQAQRVSPAVLFRTVNPAGSAPNWRIWTQWHIFVPVAAVILGIFALAVAVTRDAALVAFSALGVVLALLLLRLAGAALKAVLARLPAGNMRPVRHALRNIHGAGSIAAATVNIVGLGTALLIVVVLLESNLYGQLTGAYSGNAPAFVATDLFDDEIETLEDMVASEPSFAGFDWSPMLRGMVSAVNGAEPQVPPEGGDFAETLLAGDIPVTWLRTLPENSTVTAGEWWPADYSGPPLISLHSTLSTQLDLDVGDTLIIQLFGEPIEARIANFRDYDWQQGTDFLVAFSPGDVEIYPSTFFGKLQAEPGQEKELERALATALPMVSFIPIGNALNRLAAILGQLGLAVALIGSLALANGLIVLIGTTTAGYKRRRTDAVVQKALGATRAEVTTILIVESGLVCLFATLAATLIGTLGAWVITRRELDTVFAADPYLIAGVAAAALLVTIVPVVVSTWRLLSEPSGRYLRNG